MLSSEDMIVRLKVWSSFHPLCLHGFEMSLTDMKRRGLCVFRRALPSVANSLTRLAHQQETVGIEDHNLPQGKIVIGKFFICDKFKVLSFSSYTDGFCSSCG